MNLDLIASNISISDEILVLEKILQKDINLVSFNRNLTEKILNYTKFLVEQEKFEINTNEKNFQLEFQKLPQFNGKKEFLEDLNQTIDEFQNISKSKKLKIQLAIIDKVQCPKFHVDFVSLRLITTYFGEGTIYLENNNSNRKELGLGDNSKVPICQKEIKQLKTCSISILKGEAFPHNLGKGIIHKSPEIKNFEKRLFFKIEN